jgi:hypothetical protein
MIDSSFAGHTLPGERIIWTGEPKTGVMFTSKDALLIPFSILWLGFAIFWTVTAASTRAGLGFTLYGLMFVAIGVLVMGGRFFADAWLRAGTRYAVTDERILISRPKPFGDFSAIALDRLPDTRLSERKDGCGTIRFGQRTSIFAGNGFSIWVPALDPTPQFLAISDAKRVFDIIQRASRDVRS